jgi:hypothetical protein
VGTRHYVALRLFGFNKLVGATFIFMFFSTAIDLHQKTADSIHMLPFMLPSKLAGGAPGDAAPAAIPSSEFACPLSLITGNSPPLKSVGRRWP